MENNNVLKDCKLHNCGIVQKHDVNPLVCPYPRKYFAFIHDGLNDICCGVFPSFLDYNRWRCSLSLDDLFVSGNQFSFSQIRFTNVCRLA